MQDKDIIVLYENRDETALVETDDRYGKYAYTIAMNLLGDTREAEEVESDTLMQLWNTIPPQKPSNLKAFIGKIARNLSLNRIEERLAEKRSCGLSLVFDELEEVLSSEREEIVDQIALKDALKAFLAKLSSNDRILFVKRYWYNESIASLSRSERLTKSAVKVKLHRLRAELKSYLKSNGIG